MEPIDLGASADTPEATMHETSIQIHPGGGPSSLPSSPCMFRFS
jgi:hypothetical protein